MDPVTASMIANVGASLLGEVLATGDRRKIAELQEEAMALYGDMSAPTLERVLAEKLGPSAMEGIQKDQGNRSARNLAIQQMMEAGLSGGMDAGSQLALEEGRRAAAAHEQQGRGAVRQEFQRRGLGGAGEAMLQQQAQQAGADRMALTGLQSASDARSRALQALAQGGAMAGQAEGQDFERAARIAQSQDAINRFNAEMRSQANYYNAGLGQQDFNNRLTVADRKYGAIQDRVGGLQGKVQGKKQTIGGIGQAFGYGGAAYGQAQGPKPQGLQGPPRKAQRDEEGEWW